MPLDVGAVRREHVESYIESLVDRGQKPATVSLAYRSLAPFWKWLVAEDEIRESPMTRMRPPIVPVDPPAILRQEQIHALLKACEGQGFDERRDTALVLLMFDTGMRRGEAANLKLDDVDLDLNVAVVFGKARTTRAVPFGRKTAKALDRYLRARRKHPLADDAAFWLGRKGPLTGNGILQLIRRRGREAGLKDLHPHLFRHTYAHAMLSGGMQEGDLMRLAGWKSRGMLERYGASAAAERARQAYQRLSPADRLL